MLKKIINILNSQWALFLSLVFGFILNNHNEKFIKVFFHFSNFSQQIIQLLLPFIVFCLVLSGLISVGKQGVKIIIISLITVFILNVSFFILMYPVFFTSFFNIGDIVINHDSSILLYKLNTFNIPKLSPEIGLFGAFIFWIISLFYNKNNEYIQKKLSYIAVFLMKNIFGTLIPFFIFGFILNVNFNFIIPVLKSCYHIVFLVSFLQYTSLFIVMFALDGFRLFINIKHMLPAIFVGFSTMSSGMALPKIIFGLENIGFDKKKSAPILSLISIPFTWGDIFIMPSLMVICIKVFGFEVFSFFTYLKCAVFFAVLKHTCCNIAGGCAICLIPLMTKILGFNQEMCLFVISLTIALDAFSTAANVSGHFFAPRLIDKIINKI